MNDQRDSMLPEPFFAPTRFSVTETFRVLRGKTLCGGAEIVCPRPTRIREFGKLTQIRLKCGYNYTSDTRIKTLWASLPDDVDEKSPDPEVIKRGPIFASRGSIRTGGSFDNYAILSFFWSATL